ncbi:MAG TPA: ABC transporter ATP-binding protein [Ornithinimicrobium sp.]|uniref:ABC transporter ATP-binding protein n=1 Tax=Ornithinimicrobium sp. TaxID=1977084 RepID=UPI002B45FF20|nr:ABC transporter ATP-binding protein [Ornithinimicrobium sp.]HKJ10842.1 ABC transporter ATP-binding protein [Ornithinimicrobium sp.]
MMELRDLTVRFGGFTAVDQVDLDLPRGRVLAVLGPSGCGKSTLLRAIAGLEDLAGGSVSFAGQDLASVPTHRRGFALMFQDGQLFAHQSVADNVAYPLRLRSVPRAHRDQRVSELLEMVGLSRSGAQRISELSGGEQQRVALARALAAQPRLLLLDEPLSALDRELRERLAGDVRGILAETGTTALLVTHDHDEACAMSDDLAVMMRGRVVQHGHTAQVWRAPADAEVARFLGYTTVLWGEPAGRVTAAAGGGGRLASEGLALRRSALRVVPTLEARGPRSLTESRLHGRVEEVVMLSDVATVRLSIEGVGPATAVAPRSRPPQVGDDVAVTVDPEGIAPLPDLRSTPHPPAAAAEGSGTT